MGVKALTMGSFLSTPRLTRIHTLVTWKKELGKAELGLDDATMTDLGHRKKHSDGWLWK